jgi:hypothetical protein
MDVHGLLDRLHLWYRFPASNSALQVSHPPSTRIGSWLHRHRRFCYIVQYPYWSINRSSDEEGERGGQSVGFRVAALRELAVHIHHFMGFGYRTICRVCSGEYYQPRKATIGE